MQLRISNLQQPSYEVQFKKSMLMMCKRKSRATHYRFKTNINVHHEGGQRNGEPPIAILPADRCELKLV